jgi:glycosyltransferase involved in cell wall biosynthesis
VTILTTHQVPGDWGDQVYDLGRGNVERRLRDRAADWLWHRLAAPAALHRHVGRVLATTIRRAVAERSIEVLEMEESFGWAEQVQQVLHIPLSVRLHGPWFLNGSVQGIPEDAAFQRRVAHEGRAIRRAAGVTAPSRDVLERTRNHYGLALDQAEVIPTLTPLIPPADRWQPTGCAPGHVLFIGRFDRHKGGDLIVEAFARILPAAPQARLWFAGPDPGHVDATGRRWHLQEFVDDRLTGAQASGRVCLLGPQPHSALHDLRRRASVVVVCSRYENCPLTALEAMALGCPIVAARVGGIPEVIRDGIDGLLHRPGDPDDLAAKILALLGNPDHAAQLGRHAACRCEQEFDPMVVATRMAAHYHRLRELTALGSRA